MPRKSARILSKKRKRTITDEEEIITAFSRKRRATEKNVEENSSENSSQNSSQNSSGQDTEITKRLQEFQSQNHFVPISHTKTSSATTTTSTATSTSCSDPAAVANVLDLVTSSPTHQRLHTTPQDQLLLGPPSNTFRLRTLFVTPLPLRLSPLPSLEWADSQEVWQLMLHKEQLYTHDRNMFSRHPCLQKRMRTILLDWLIEVCEVYRLHRESFYLATEFIDRYLSISKDVQKQQLQLIGVSALFVAAKLEEVYPPKLAEFAYVTDGACTEQEILDQELLFLKTLKWDLAPMTINSWLNVYMQLVNVEKLEDSEQNFVIPQYSAHSFIQIMRLLDLCLLDVDSLQFAFSALAASALYHMSSEHVALSVSGFQWEDIAPCVHWMSPFAMTLREIGPTELKFFPNVLSDDAHNIQTHCVDVSLLERGQERQAAVKSQMLRASPELSRSYTTIITPPASTKGKCQRPTDDGDTQDSSEQRQSEPCQS